MPTDGYYTKISDVVQQRRKSLIAKWRTKGCTENKINALIQRRIKSIRKYW